MSGRFNVNETTIPGVYLLERQPRADERGWLERMFCTTDLAELLGSRGIVQVNRTLTRSKATVRGMHYQVAPYEETKIVCCTRGAVYDVIIDLRRDSPTFTQWFAVELTSENRKMVYIPAGFAHGFQTLEDATEVFYQISEFFAPEYGRGVRWDDPAFSIGWPEQPPFISDRDKSYPDYIRMGSVGHEFRQS